jgi:hypothetical protein
VKYNIVALLMSNSDASGERFLVKVVDMLNNKAQRFIPQYMSTVSPFLIKQHTVNPGEQFLVKVAEILHNIPQ